MPEDNDVVAIIEVTAELTKIIEWAKSRSPSHPFVPVRHQNRLWYQNKPPWATFILNGICPPKRCLPARWQRSVRRSRHIPRKSYLDGQNPTTVNPARHCRECWQELAI